MKKILFIILFIILSCTACQKNEKTQIDFNIDKDFKIMSVTQDNKIYHISMKSEDHIEKFLKNFKKKYPNEDITLNISLFHLNTKHHDFSIENLNEFRQFITYATNSNSYTIKEYLSLPNIDAVTSISEFKNEKIEETKNLITIYIEMNKIEDVGELIAELKTYLNIVKELNNTTKTIQIIVNNTYIYDNNDYLIKIKTLKL